MSRAMSDMPAPENSLRTRVQPYLDLARVRAPIGWLLLMWPCWWAVALAEPTVIEGLRFLGLFLIGAIVMRTAGCVYNDIVDRDFDAQVERTRNRPLASGRIKLSHALLFMAANALIGLVVLMQLNGLAIIVALSSIFLIAAYPFMKRITWWPQAWLGLTFNWGALVGWAAVRGDIGWPALLLYAAGIAWTLGYDTIYAHQDKDDDALIGVKSTARLLGTKTRPWLSAFYALTLTGLAAAAIAAGKGWPTLLLLLLPTAHAVWQLRVTDFDSPASCWRSFRANNSFAALVFVAFLAG